MPYIGQEARKELNTRHLTPCGPGELNYILADRIDDYIQAHGLRYHTLNDVIGVLECLKMEVYRRIAAPYEDIKIEENGDVFTVKTG